MLEEAVQFSCKHKRLYGILHSPSKLKHATVAVIIVTGGPQIRSGPHRLYVDLSRFLCDHGYVSLRFDYEGMGDSEGEFVGFQYAGPSIRAAVQFLQERFSPELDFVFWSLCDGATASVLHCVTHPEHVKGMILCNPLVITDEGLARSTIRHYYWQRLFDEEFWRKVRGFKPDLKDSLISFWQSLKKARFLSDAHNSISDTKRLPGIVFDSLHRFPWPVRIILSTDDIVANNFLDELGKNRAIKHDYKSGRIMNHTIRNADHTFIDPRARNEMFSVTLQALNEMVSGEKNY